MLGAICGSAISMDLPAQSMDPLFAQKSMVICAIYGFCVGGKSFHYTGLHNKLLKPLAQGASRFEKLLARKKVTGPKKSTIACHWPELARRLQIAGGPVLIVEACNPSLAQTYIHFYELILLVRLPYVIGELFSKYQPGAKRTCLIIVILRQLHAATLCSTLFRRRQSVILFRPL